VNECKPLAAGANTTVAVVGGHAVDPHFAARLARLGARVVSLGAWHTLPDGRAWQMQPAARHRQAYEPSSIQLNGIL